MTQTLYSNLGVLQSIGIKPPILSSLVDSNMCLNIKLKPPRFPKNQKTSKKCYDGIFVRAMGHFYHLYDLKERLYIVSLDKLHFEPHEWIDSHRQLILDRVTNVSQQKES